MTAPQQRWYLAMCPHYWGRGHSREEAVKKMKEAGAPTIRQRVVYLMPYGADKPYVDELGRIGWTWKDGADKSEEPVIIEKKGIEK